MLQPLLHLPILDLDVGISCETSHQVVPKYLHSIFSGYIRVGSFAGIIIVVWIDERHWCTMFCCLCWLRFMLTH